MSRANLNDKRDFKDCSIKTIKNITAHIFIDQYKFSTIFYNAKLEIFHVTPSPGDSSRRIAFCLKEPELVSKIAINKMKEYTLKDLEPTYSETTKIANHYFFDHGDHGNLTFQERSSQVFRFNKGVSCIFSFTSKILNIKKEPQFDIFSSRKIFLERERTLYIHLYSPNCIMETKFSPVAKASLWLYFDIANLDKDFGFNFKEYSLLNIKSKYLRNESEYYSENIFNAAHFFGDITDIVQKKFDEKYKIYEEDDDSDIKDCLAIEDCKNCEEYEECDNKYITLKLRKLIKANKETEMYLKEKYNFRKEMS